MSTCFDDRIDLTRVERAPFLFGHRLLGHPALTLDSLARVLPRLPAAQVMYSTRQLANGDDFEGTFRRRPIDRSIEETIESIRHADAYIMVNSPQVDPAFADLYRALIDDVADVMHQRGLRGAPIDPQLYLFIASPNSVTPFHIDRYSTFLMQFRGSKTVTVSRAWDPQVVSPGDAEEYLTYRRTRLPWSPEIDRHATAFSFQPGDALHIPYMAGHHVHNGPGDVSISMSIIFNTPQTRAWRAALEFNMRERRVLRPLGLVPAPIGARPRVDALKARAWRTWSTVRHPVAAAQAIAARA